VGRIDGHPIVVCAFEFGFMGGAWPGGEDHAGDRLATRKRILLIVTCSGGPDAGRAVADADGQDLGRARAAGEERVPYFVLLADPTTGGDGVVRQRWAI
jgi:acetyl-CoA carboxylase beta subunit